MVSSTPRPHFTPGKDPVPILQEAGWGYIFRHTYKYIYVYVCIDRQFVYMCICCVCVCVFVKKSMIKVSIVK